MADFELRILSIAQYIEWYNNKELVIQPKFQRRAVWQPDARSYLVDTVVRSLPMPMIYLREAINTETQLKAYEVVDGQQRLQAILDYCSGVKPTVLRSKHNVELGDVQFRDLPSPVQRAFMDYRIATEVMYDAPDPEVWALFERLNTYTLSLNEQERLNAKWFGRFKQVAYKLASEQEALDAWRDMKVFTNRQIARMKEVELTSDVLVAIVKGISDITEIKKTYAEFDDQFADETRSVEVFRTMLRYLGAELAGGIRTTRFRRSAWFYSLCVSASDVLSGVPDGFGPAAVQSGTAIAKRMATIDNALRQAEPPKGLIPLRDSLARATSHAPQRRLRHRHFYDMLTLTNAAWDRKWQEMTSEE